MMGPPRPQMIFDADRVKDEEKSKHFDEWDKRRKSQKIK